MLIGNKGFFRPALKFGGEDADNRDEGKYLCWIVFDFWNNPDDVLFLSSITEDAMIINTNISTLTGLNFSRLNNLSIRKTFERLSSGLRINHSSDDPSGLAISKGMTAQERGLQVASHNGQDGINLIHTMDGALSEIQDMLNRMRDLAVRAANEATLTTNDRSKLNAEMAELYEEITRTAEATTFNTKQILVGEVAGGKWGTQQIPNTGLGMYISISSDGEKITFYSVGSIYTINADGTGLTDVDNGLVTGGSSDISGDGSKVVFMDANPFLYSVNSDGTGLIQLTTDFTSLPGTTVGGSPITEDGSKVVYYKQVAGNFDIYIQNTDGTGELRLTTDPALDGDPVISADGSKVIFGSIRTGAPELFVINSDGTGEQQLTSIGAVTPSISGDGSKVAFLGGAGDIYVINSNGTGLQQLTFGVSPNEAVMSNDGSKIAYVNPAGELRVIDSDGSNDTFVATAGLGGSFISISGDGTKIAYRNNADAFIWLASLESESQAHTLQVGPNNGEHYKMEMEFLDARASALGVSYLNVTTTSGAQQAIDTVDSAIEKVSEYRAYAGIIERRLGHITNDLAAEHINVSASRSRIADADMAVEISEFTRVQIMAQSNQAALAQANATPQALLQLLK
ncbi:MAG: flagellin [bacterium]